MPHIEGLADSLRQARGPALVYISDSQPPTVYHLDFDPTPLGQGGVEMITGSKRDRMIARALLLLALERVEASL